MFSLRYVIDPAKSYMIYHRSEGKQGAIYLIPGRDGMGAGLGQRILPPSPPSKDNTDTTDNTDDTDDTDNTDNKDNKDNKDDTDDTGDTDNTDNKDNTDNTDNTLPRRRESNIPARRRDQYSG